MKIYSFIIPLLLVLFCSHCCHAQQKQKYLYEDSAIMYPDAKNNIATEKPAVNDSDEGKKVMVDTVLYKNELMLHPDSVSLLKNEKPFSYAKNLDSLLKRRQNKKETNPSPSLILRFFSASLTKFFFWMLAGLFVLFILYRLFFAEGFFQRPAVKAKVDIIKEGESSGMLNGTDYDRLIGGALSDNNYRLAVRYLYLQSLQKLTAAGTINFAADKTNYQYLDELQGRPFKNDFAYLTRQYEYIWYGGFAIDGLLFSSLQNNFRQFNKQL